MNQIIQKAVSEISNLIFPSKESDGIEHVDMHYQAFLRLIETKLTEAYMAGRSDAVEFLKENLMSDTFINFGTPPEFRGETYYCTTLKRLEQAKQPTTQCCEECEIVIDRHPICDNKSCPCHSVKDNN